TTTDLSNNLACVYNRLNLFSKVALKNYKSILEKQKELESSVQSCQEKLESCEELLRKTQSETRKSLQQISTEIQQSKPLTKREVLNLVQEIAEQTKLVEKEALILTEDLNQKVQKATTEYQEAIQATEDIEPPAVGFAKTADYKGGLANQVNAVMKQNNTLFYLASKQSQKLIELEEKFDRLKQKVNTIIEKEIQPADPEDSISSLAKRLDNFSISELPTQEDQIRGYRQIARNRHQVARTTRRVFRRNNYNLTLETAVDPERQLEISRERRANLVLAEAYYVRYDVPLNTTPIEEVTATGWGKEFSDDEVTPGKVTILSEVEEESDWNDDEISGGKTLVIQEKFAQNQQYFLDEYLPQWDDQFATQKQRSELEWENPFTAKRGEDHTVLYISEEKDDLPYPKFQKFEQLAAQIVKRHEEHAFPTAADDAESSTSYQPLPDAIMGPAVYPPARQNPQQAYRPDYQFGYPQGKGNTFYGGYDPSLWSDVISRWESITINRLNSQTWSDNKAKLAFVENLLGEKAVFPLNNGKTLDRITCEETKNLWSFLADFRQLAIKSRKLYFPSIMEKLFAKLPPSLSKRIEELFKVRHPSLSAGVLPAIKFTHTFVSEMCKDAALSKELRDLSLCSAIPIPGYYKNNKKKYGIRKSRTYKGKPHNSHVKPFKRKYKDDKGRVKKCKCFIYGKEGHFAKDCRSKQGNISRSAVYQELDLDDNWDIVLADFNDSSVYNISEGEGNVHQNISIVVQDTPIEEAAFMAIEESDDEQDIEEEYDSHHAFMFHPRPPTKIADMVQSAGSWKPDKELPTHKPKEEKDFSSNEVRLLKELLKEKTEQVQQMIRDQAKEYYESKIAIKEKEELWQTERSLLVWDLTDALKIIDQLKAKQMKLEEEKDKEIKVQFSKEEFPPLGNSQIVRPFMEAEAHYSGSTTTALKIRKITNQLYNVKVKFETPNCLMFGTTTIIDTGASTCCINKKVIPEEALEPLTQTVFFNGLNSRQQATHRIKQGYFLIEGNKFKIPLIYAFDMRASNGIEMLIGANFLRSMRGGIRIEGDEITIYKKVTRIKTSNQTEIAEIAELEKKKGLRSFLGILNYARNHIPKLGILLRPLYEKTNAHVDKRMKSSDYELVRKIKEQVQNLPDLEIPPENAYIILETDGCMEGWGGIIKWKKRKEDPRGSERICAYASGKFSTTQSTIDAEINACINTLEKLKIYYLDKQEVTLRTDCQAIISFYNKTNSNKSSRVRASVEDIRPSGSHFFDSFSNCSLKILLGSSKTCIFPSDLFMGSLPLMEKLSSLLAKLDIESSRSAG
nr:putative polyprotein [Tanacetum cinerariifolium]